MTRLSKTPTRIARAPNFGKKRIDSYIDNSECSKYRRRRYMTADGEIHHDYGDLNFLRNQISADKDNYVKFKDWDNYRPMLTLPVDSIDTFLATQSDLILIGDIVYQRVGQLS